MITFDNINDLFTFENECPQCKKSLKKFVINTNYDDLVSKGPQDRFCSFSASKNHLKVRRSFTVEDLPIEITYTFDSKNNSMQVEFHPSADEIVEKLPMAQSFYELEEVRYAAAQNNGLINIWNVIRRAEKPFFVLQECKNHFRRVSVVEFDGDDEKIVNIQSYDDFVYTPTNKTEGQYYVLHHHTSPKTKRSQCTIHVTSDINELDVKRGVVFLQAPNDEALMNFDYSDPIKLSRYCNQLFALKG